MIAIAAVSAALAVFVAVLSMAHPGRAPVASRMNRYEREGQPTREELLAEPFAARVGQPLLGRLRSIVDRFLPGSWVGGIQHRLMLAGDPASLHGFLTIQLIALGGALFVLLMGMASANSAPQFGALIVAVVLLAGAPLYWLRLRVAARKKALIRALPDAVDLIVTTVEAGLGLDAALSEVGHETDGPLGEELRLTVRETTLGRSRRDALTRLNGRTDVPELKTFIQSVIQAEQTGIPVGQVLRTQAAQIRLKKRQRAEAEAQRAPVKMVVVLALLVLPAMWFLVMGPAALRMAEQF